MTSVNNFFGGGSGIEWATITASTTAVPNTGYIVDASLSAVILTLPASPSIGDVVGISVSDNTNTVTIDRNGYLLLGNAANKVLADVSTGIQIVYTGAITGWASTTALTLDVAAAIHTHTTADITDLSSYTGFDSRYYTETEADNRFVNITGDTMTGVLTVTNGTAATPGLRVTNAQSGIYSTSTSMLGFAVNGVAAATLNSSGFFQAGSFRHTGTRFFEGSNQVLYEILGTSSVAGPVLKARWDTSTGDRYLEVGTQDNLNTYTAVARFQGSLASGSLAIYHTTASTSTTTGAQTIAGGLGVAGAGNFGGGVNASSFTTSGDVILSAALGTIRKTDDTTSLLLAGGQTATPGGNILLRGPSHATEPNRVNFRSGSTVIAYTDANGLTVPTAITHSGVNTSSGSTASRLVYFGGSSGDGAAIELRGSTYSGSPNTGFFRVGGTYVGNWTSSSLNINAGISTVFNGLVTLSNNAANNQLVIDSTSIYPTISLQKSGVEKGYVYAFDTGIGVWGNANTGFDIETTDIGKIYGTWNVESGSTFTINGTTVSLSGHTHTAANISDSSLAGRSILTGSLVSGSANGKIMVWNGTFPGLEDSAFTTADFAAVSHTHAATDITSGTLDSTRLPIASAGSLGGIRVGSGLSIDGSGILSSTGGAGATVITTDTTVYVATTGNDSNNGSVSTPWLTLQHAMNVVNTYAIDKDATLTIQVQDGTYASGGLTLGGPHGDRIRIIGNTTTPANVVLSITPTTNGNCILIQSRLSEMNGFTITQPVVAGSSFFITVNRTGFVRLGANMVYNTGGSLYALYVAGGCTVYVNGGTWNMSDINTTISRFVFVTDKSFVQFSSCTFNQNGINNSWYWDFRCTRDSNVTFSGCSITNMLSIVETSTFNFIPSSGNTISQPVARTLSLYSSVIYGGFSINYTTSADNGSGLSGRLIYLDGCTGNVSIDLSTVGNSYYGAVLANGSNITFAGGTISLPSGTGIYASGGSKAIVDDASITFTGSTKYSPARTTANTPTYGNNMAIVIENP